ncbi:MULTISPECIES: hypothetical protein [Niallia]|uniref:Uncharacterized protein n=2 Tax=Bacillati TaxID=1783272 RepID=A0A437K7G5_9BACI|nr:MULTISPECIES: hypothetical protein [Niallia]MDK8642421.1 hypothetical protein [Niallia taxi]MED4040601.1 hypothetical protein [Niallia taxi]MED4057041.1 hypothetical protein [Niallia taxi]MED4121613.1 hypothetical protein [Niallia taxi]RVT59551.1 hypothetical protein EM808_19865 [Niallia taxi]
MTKKSFLIMIGSTLTLLCVVYFIFLPSQKEAPMDLKATQEQVAAQIESDNEYTEKTIEWATEQKENLDVGFIEPHTEKVNDVSPQRDVVNYFITGILKQDVELFMSTFQTETISSDLFKVEETDKQKVAQDIINRISKNNSIKGVNFKEKKGVFGGETNEVKLEFQYKDGKSSLVTLSLESIEEAHSDHAHDDILVITTSSWDIIKQIEKE